MIFMYKLILGTTPTIKFTFRAIDPSDIQTAIMTIENKDGWIVLEKALDTAQVGGDYISWTLSQAETLALGKTTLRCMLNWVLENGTRGVSVEETIKCTSNHIEREI